MEEIEKLYFQYLESTTEESRKWDETFLELEQEYCGFILDREYQELRSIFGDTDD